MHFHEKFPYGRSSINTYKCFMNKVPVFKEGHKIVNVKSEIKLNFVAFLENLNFNIAPSEIMPPHYFLLWRQSVGRKREETQFSRCECHEQVD